MREDVLWGFPERPDVSRLLRIDSAPARAVIGLFIVVEAIIGLSTLSGVGHPLPTLVGLLLVTSATILGSWPGDHPMSVRGSAAVVAAAVVTAGLVAWQLPRDRPPGYEAWFVGADSFLFLLLALRGRAGWAWSGMALVSVVVVLWSATIGPGLGVGVNLAARNSATLLVGTLFAVGLARTATRIASFREAERLHLAEKTSAEASLAERRRHVVRLKQATGDLLRTIARGEELTASERVECVVVEGALRDGARATSLSVEPVVSAAAAARRRGVEVVLLDDRVNTPLPAAVGREVVAWIARGLDDAQTGAVTARVLPDGREALATLVTRSGDGSVTRTFPN